MNIFLAALGMISSGMDPERIPFPNWSTAYGFELRESQEISASSRNYRQSMVHSDLSLNCNINVEIGYLSDLEARIRRQSSLIDRGYTRGSITGHPLGVIVERISREETIRFESYSPYVRTFIYMARKTYREGHKNIQPPLNFEGPPDFAEEMVRWFSGHCEMRYYGRDAGLRTVQGQSIPAILHSGSEVVYMPLKAYVAAIGGSVSFGGHGTRAQVVKGGRTSIVCAGALEAKVGGSMVDAGGAVLMKGGEIYVSSALAGRL